MQAMRRARSLMRHVGSGAVGALIGLCVLVIMEDPRRDALAAAWQKPDSYAAADIADPSFRAKMAGAPPRLAAACRAFREATHLEAKTGHVSAARAVALYCADLAAALARVPQAHPARAAARHYADTVTAAHDQIERTRAALKAAGRSGSIHYVAREAILRDLGVMEAARAWTRTYASYLSEVARS